MPPTPTAFTTQKDPTDQQGTICHTAGRYASEYGHHLSSKPSVSTVVPSHQPEINPFDPSPGPVFFVQKNNCTQLIFICALNRRYTVPIETHRFLLRHYTTFSVTLFQVQLPLLAMQVAEGWLQNKTTFSAHTHTRTHIINPTYAAMYLYVRL